MLLHTCNSVIQEITINFMTVCILCLKNDTLYQSSKGMTWAKLSTRGNAWHVQKPNLCSQNYKHKNIRQEKWTSKGKQLLLLCLPFFRNAASTDGVGMAAEEGCWVSTTQSMGEGISTQSSSPETTFLQKGSSSSGFHKSPMKATQQRQMHKYNILSGRFFIEQPKHEAKYI